MVKIENIKTTEFTVNYPLANGHIKSYIWKPVYGNRRSMLEVPEEVYEYIRYETCTFEKGYLILAKEEENSEIIEEVNEVLDEKEVKVYTVEEIKNLLGKVTSLKKEITADTPKEIVSEFVRVANDIKVDSDSVKTYLATLLGYKENKEILFPYSE